jgi:virginiamycin A acetyltransferase
MNAVFLALAFPMAVLSGFGRFSGAFTFFAHLVSLAPGLPGDYLRIAYYYLTLEECSLDSRVSFGSVFAHPQVSLDHGVYIGCYCVIGASKIGDRTLIASNAQIFGGRNQHPRAEDGRLSRVTRVRQVVVGEDCWIGAAAIVMDDVGSGSTVGAGAIVTKPMPAACVAVGNPARPLRSSHVLATSSERHEDGA